MTVIESALSEEVLQHCAERAPIYDRENKFFSEDFEELRKAGYLAIAVPADFGGGGMNLAQVCEQQARLAYRAPATALALNMHIYWTGVAADLWRSGDRSCEWILTETMDGEVFAAGHGEVGNDFPLMASVSKARPTDGGYTLHGRKIFSSLSPVWTRLGVHAVDDSDPTQPMIVHAFIARGAKGYSIRDTWDVLGMRATRSDDTILDGVFVDDAHVVRVVPAGLAGADNFVLSVFAWAEPTFASIYQSIGRRAFDLAIQGVRLKSSIAMGGRSMAYNPMYQHVLADMYIELESAGAHVGKVASDWSLGVDHGAMWPAKLVAAKFHATESAKRVVDMAMELSGGAGMFKGNELERLYRDVRCGGFHPANGPLVHELVGKSTLGILGEEPRWG
jgi:alkylation response protein AidB-like acyl-CoA dehydrogenase